MKLPLSGVDRVLWIGGVAAAVIAIGILAWTQLRPRAEAPARLIPVSVQSSSLTPHVAPNTAAMAAASGASGASFGQLYGLHQTPDPLELKSSVALVMDQDTNEVLLAKNSDAILPIASLTKLMTALVTVEARLSMDESITITVDDVDTEKNSSSRLAVGSTLTRGELLHLALMASENRAAHALGRSYPGGMRAFVSAMNAKARQLGGQATVLPFNQSHGQINASLGEDPDYTTQVERFMAGLSPKFAESLR